MCNGEAANTNLVVCSLTRSEFEPTIYCIRGELANHYISDEYPELNSMQNSKCSKSLYSIETLVLSYYDDMPPPRRKKTPKHSQNKTKTDY